jgi:hypothetical protein
VSAAILATGSDRRASLALAAAVAAEAAPLTGGATLLIEAGEAAQKRGPTLLAAPGSRRVEEALRAAGREATARGQLCHLALAGSDGLSAAPRAVQDSG